MSFVLLTYRSLPFRREKQKTNAEVAEVVEKSHAEGIILCCLFVEALGCGYSAPCVSWLMFWLWFDPLVLPAKNGQRAAMTSLSRYLEPSTPSHGPASYSKA